MKRANGGQYGYFRFGGSNSVPVDIEPVKTHQIVLIHLSNGTIRIKCKKHRCKFSAGPFNTFLEAESSAAEHLKESTQ